MSRSFFFGLVVVYDWEWLWGRTAAQVELRTIDQPIIVYKKEKNKEQPWKNGTVSKDYADKAYQKWLEGKKRREKEGKTIDLAKTFSQAKKVSLNELLNNGEEKETE